MTACIKEAARQMMLRGWIPEHLSKIESKEMGLDMGHGGNRVIKDESRFGGWTTRTRELLSTKSGKIEGQPSLDGNGWSGFSLNKLSLSFPLNQAEDDRSMNWKFRGQARVEDTSGKEPTCQCRRYGRHVFNPWVGKISWRRAWQPTPVFLPGKFHGQRGLAGYSPWGLQRVRTIWVSEHSTTEVKVIKLGLTAKSI